MSIPQTEANTCACGCGERIADGRTWKRGHASRGRGGYTALPGPDDEDFEDLGEAEDPGGWPEDGLPGHQPEPGAPSGPSEPQGDLPDDEPPARLSAVPGRGRAKRRPATAAARKDIAAKVGLMLEIPGRVWQARDPLCGGTFVAQRPAISDAVTELVMQSPDLMEWFMGTGGGFMLWLNLAAACGPVATTVWAHHVVHSLEAPPEDGQQPPFPQAQYVA